MSLMKADKVVTQTMKTMVTTSTTDDSPANAVVTKDYLTNNMDTLKDLVRKTDTDLRALVKKTVDDLTALVEQRYKDTKDYVDNEVDKLKKWVTDEINKGKQAMDAAVALVNQTLNNKHDKKTANESTVHTNEENGTIDLSRADNHDINYTASTVFNFTNPKVGQSGVVHITGAKNISGYGSSIKWRNKPSSLNDEEFFAYFVFNGGKIAIGRV